MVYTARQNALKLCCIAFSALEAPCSTAPSIIKFTTTKLIINHAGPVRSRGESPACASAPAIVGISIVGMCTVKSAPVKHVRTHPISPRTCSQWRRGMDAVVLGLDSKPLDHHRASLSPFHEAHRTVCPYCASQSTRTSVFATELVTGFNFLHSRCIREP